MIFRIRPPKGIFGQNMSDLPNGSLTGVGSCEAGSQMICMSCWIVQITRKDLAHLVNVFPPFFQRNICKAIHYCIPVDDLGIADLGCFGKEGPT